MNTLRTSVAVAVLLASGLAVAQSTGTTTKPAAKPAAQSAAPAAKPAAKGKLMTRDELRTCMANNQEIDDQAAKLKTRQADVLKERDELKALKETNAKSDSDLGTQGDALKAEIAATNAAGEELKVAAPKMEKAELKAKQDEFNARAAALQAKIDAYNAALTTARAEAAKAVDAYNARVDAFQKHTDDFNEAVEDLNDKRNAWKLKCGNRSYDENDEIAIKKELAGKK